MGRVGRRWAALAVLCAPTACGRTPLWEAPDDPCRGEDGDDRCLVVSRLERAVDILFVIDNSGSMGVEQGVLASNFPGFLDVLERGRFGASYRIGITTTDAPGLLDVSSCRTRLDRFLFWDPKDDVQIDASYEGCLSRCSTDVVTTVPTTTADDDVPSPRPWIEKNGADTNLDGVEIGEALRCVGPQGINGSGFEAPLEGLMGVLDGRRNSDGFLRDEALLAVVFVTDETDCSMPPEHFDPLVGEAGVALRSDPLDDPTSAVCWNAGTACVGGPGVYDDCFPVDRRFDASITDDVGQAVLYPVERYIEGLREASQAKAARGGSAQVLVAVIGGVPLDYPVTGKMLFADSDLPEFNDEYGIGPGCGRGTETVDSPPGIPPVRLREFAEAFSTEGRNLFSICSSDYTVALEQIASGLARMSARACVPGCVADRYDDREGLQPACELWQSDTNGDERKLERCVTLGDTWSFPSGSPDVCYRALSDRGDTPQAWDDISRQCITQDWNLELVVERPSSMPEPVGVSVDVRCRLTRPVGDGCHEDP